MRNQLLWFVSILLILPSCLGRKLAHFPRSGSAICMQEQEGLKLKLNRFNAAEVQDYFGADLVSEGYLPLHLHIYNGTNSRYILKATTMEFPVISPRKVLKFLHHDVYTFSWVGSYYSIILLWPALSIVIPAAFAMHKNNREITENLVEKTLKRYDVIEIKPYETVNRFIFTCEEELPPIANISLIEQETHSLLTFQIPFSQELQE